MSSHSESESPQTARQLHVNPILRNALRISLTATEYKLLHEYLIKRSPIAIQGCAPSPSSFEAIVQSKDTYNEAAVRGSLRVFVTTAAGMKLLGFIAGRLLGRAKNARCVSFH
jgi:hypothetical protein